MVYFHRTTGKQWFGASEHKTQSHSDISRELIHPGQAS